MRVLRLEADTLPVRHHPIYNISMTVIASRSGVFSFLDRMGDLYEDRKSSGPEINIEIYEDSISENSSL